MKVLRFLDQHGEEYLCVVALVIMTIIIGLQVVMRYIFQSSITWSEELSRYLCIWLVFIGSSFAVRKGRHICVDALHDALPPKPALCVAIIADVLFLIFAIIVAIFGFEVLARILDSGQQSPAMGVSMGTIYSALPIGFVLIVFRLLQSIYLKVRAYRAGGGEEDSSTAEIPLG